MSGCGDFFVSPGSVDHVQLSSRGFLLKPGDPAVQLTASVVKVDGSTGDVTTTATWTSDTPAVATISSSGNITAVAAGTATITAKSGSKSATAVVIVTTAKFSSFTLSPAKVTLLSGKSQQLTPTVTLGDSTPPDVSAILTWTSDTTNVATVSSGGLVITSTTYAFTGLTTTASATITATFTTATDTKSATSAITLSEF